jgi:quercetin dioxygenase-like cupin family protein
LSLRRVVTGEVNGRSCIVSDGPAPGNEIFEELWLTDRKTPLGVDPVKADSRVEPGEGEIRWRVVSIPPEAVLRQILAELNSPDIGADGFHQTNTIDYVHVLEGAVTLEMDEGEVELHEGDCVVQRQTRHAWHNHGDSPVRILVVMVSLS